MDILVKLTVPNFVYKFYDDGSTHIARATAEDIMADALSDYAGMISHQVAKEREISIVDKEDSLGGK